MIRSDSKRIDGIHMASTGVVGMWEGSGGGGGGMKEYTGEAGFRQSHDVVAPCSSGQETILTSVCLEHSRDV